MNPLQVSSVTLEPRAVVMRNYGDQLFILASTTSSQEFLYGIWSINVNQTFCSSITSKSATSNVIQQSLIQHVEESSGNNSWIAGVVIGCVVGIALVVGLVVFFVRRIKSEPVDLPKVEGRSELTKSFGSGDWQIEYRFPLQVSCMIDWYSDIEIQQKIGEGILKLEMS